MVVTNMPAEGYLADYLLFWAVFLSLAIHTYCYFRFVKGRKHPRLHLVAGNALVLASLLALVFVIGETYFRYVYDETDALGILPTTKLWFQRHFHYNRYGCRDREWTPNKSPGVYRIAFVGDSFTVGHGIPNPADRFSDLLGARLNAKFPGLFEVLNCSRVGLDTREEQEIIETAIDRFQVDEVILGYCLNDIEYLIPRREQYYYFPESRFWDTNSSFLTSFVYYRLAVRSHPSVSHYYQWVMKAYRDDKIWNAQKVVLQQLADARKRHGVRVSVVIFPFFRPLGEDYPDLLAHQRVREALAEVKIPYLDLLDVYNKYEPSELMVNRFDSHPNEKANAIAAAAIWKAFFEPRFQKSSAALP